MCVCVEWFSSLGSFGGLKVETWREEEEEEGSLKSNNPTEQAKKKRDEGGETGNS